MGHRFVGVGVTLVAPQACIAMDVEVKVTLPEDLYRNLRERAVAAGRTVSDLVREAVAAPPSINPQMRAGVNSTGRLDSDELERRRSAFEDLVKLIESTPPFVSEKTDNELIFEYIDEKYG